MSSEREDLPRIEERGARWSPLALGLFSLVCDPFLIPTVLSVVRGLSELSEVARREAAGYWHEEHARVRTGAVWGMLLGGSRVLLVGVIALIVTTGTVLEPGRDDAISSHFGEDELIEVRSRLHSEDDTVRATAARHLLEIAPTLDADEERELLADAERDFPPAREGAPHVPSVIVRACASAPAIDLSTSDVARLRRLYPSLDARGRSAVLDLLVDVASDEAAWAIFLELAASERESERGLHLPIEELADLAEVWPHAFPEAWERIDESSPLSSDLVAAVALYCEGASSEPELAAYAGGLPRARARWSALRDVLDAPPAQAGLAGLLAPERARQASEAGAALGLLGCEDTRLAASGLAADRSSVRAAVESHDPRVALAGLRRWRHMHEPPPADVLRRLAASPLTRAEVLDHFRELLRADSQIPPETWTADAHVEARFVEHVAAQELDAVPESITLRGRQRISLSGGGEWAEYFYVFDVAGRSDDGTEVRHTGIAGPLPYDVDTRVHAADEAEMWLVPSRLDDAAVHDLVLERFGDPWSGGGS